MPSVQDALYREQYLAKQGQNDLIWTVTTLILQPAQIRTLNSQPVNIVTPPNSRTFLAPGQCVFVGAQGSGAYSSAPNPLLQWTGAPGFQTAINIDATNSWDGSGSARSVVPDALTSMVSTSDAFDFAGTDLLGLALQITSGGDVTGGDAPCTITLTWRPYLIG